MSDSDLEISIEEICEMANVCQEIGMIAECNYRYQASIAYRIKGTGKALVELTVKELLDIHREYGELFNRYVKDIE